MNDDTFLIKFPDATVGQANQYAGDLAQELSHDIAGLEKAEPMRDREEAQDFGATLVLVLGTATATAVAQGVRSWLTRNGTSAELYKDGTVRLGNLDTKDVAEIAKAFAKR